MTASAPTRGLVTVIGGLILLAALVAGARLMSLLPIAQWWEAMLRPDLDDPAALVFAFSALPRLVTAALCGAALGLAGALLQQALGNPLASPTTVGIEGGAQLALTAAVVFAPTLIASGREGVALIGGAATLCAVFLCARSQGLSSLSVVVAGFVVGLFCTALSACLKLLNEEYAVVLFLWGGGSLDGADWSAPLFLAPRIAGAALLAAIAIRPLSVLSLSDETARALGASVGMIRVGSLGLAVVLTAVVAASVGTIGFIGLAAPQIARFAGARRFAARLPLAALVGAALLVAIDAALALAVESAGMVRVPTGAATALLGAPLLVWLLPRLRFAAPPAPALAGAVRYGRAAPILIGLGAVLACGLAASLLVGRTQAGWTLAGAHDVAAFFPWRGPRTIVSATAGAMLAVSGILLQRLTGNPLASPEVLGIGTGVALGVTIGLLAVPEFGIVSLLGFGAAGAAASVAILLAVGARSRFAPEQLLLAGIALTSLLDVFVLTFFTTGDLRSGQLLAFISGSAYRSGWTEAAIGLLAVTCLVPLALALQRILDVLQLGEPVARELGLSLPRTRLALTGLIALLTSAGVLLAGPLSFVGLMGPHLARMLGLRRALAETAGAALVGATVMVFADWVARIAIYPRQLPAGLVAALIGLPYLLIRLGRGR